MLEMCALKSRHVYMRIPFSTFYSAVPVRSLSEINPWYNVNQRSGTNVRTRNKKKIS